MADVSVAELETYIARLTAEQQALRRSRKRAPYLLYVGLAVAPGGLFFSPLLAFALVALAVTMWLTALYITYVHTQETVERLAQARANLEIASARGQG